MEKIKFTIPISEYKIQKNHKIISIGSCFAQSMGERLEKNGFSILNQPFGTIFHPLAIQKLFSDSAVLEKDLMQRDGLWVHPDFHSVFKNESKEKVVFNILEQRKIVNELIQKADWLILTFGTSFRYFDKNLNQYIANCHKQPQKRFNKVFISMEEMALSLIPFFKELNSKNKKLRIMLTVSPVRHTKDGIMENMVSKSNLRLLTDRLNNELDFVDYFPAYEIMMDELRDYGFYKSDLIHPSEEAEDYIWEKFQETFF